MGFEPFGFAGGRVDVWAPEEDVYWGPEAEAMASERYGNPHRSAELEKPLGAVQMGLIYVRKTPPSHSGLQSQSTLNVRPAVNSEHCCVVPR